MIFGKEEKKDEQKEPIQPPPPIQKVAEESKEEQKDVALIKPVPIQNRKSVGLLIVGKTGAGKSTFINAFYNYIMGITFDQEKKFIIPCYQNNVNVPIFMNHSIENLEGKGQSVTQYSTTYEFQNVDYSITIIDTPGLGDTQGVEQDKENIKSIIKGISSQSSFNAICLVHSMSDIRKDIFLQYYISGIKSLLTQECKNNFVVCLSHGVGPPQDILLTLNQMGIPNSNYIKFENSCLFAKPDDKLMGRIWNANCTQFRKLLQAAENMKRFNSKEIKELYEKRGQLTEEFASQIRNINELEQTILQIKKSKQEIENGKIVIAKSQSFSIKVKLVRFIPKEMGYKNTICLTCGSICHDHCALSSVFDTAGDPGLKECACMGNDGVCTKCSHTFGTHKHTTTILIREEYEEEILNVQKLEALSIAKKNIDGYQKALMVMNSKITNLEKDIDTKLRSIANLFKDIERSSLSPITDYFEEYVNGEVIKLEMLLKQEGISQQVRDEMFQEKDIYSEFLKKYQQFKK